MDFDAPEDLNRLLADPKTTGGLRRQNRELNKQVAQKDQLIAKYGHKLRNLEKECGIEINKLDHENRELRKQVETLKAQMERFRALYRESSLYQHVETHPTEVMEISCNTPWKGILKL